MLAAHSRGANKLIVPGASDILKSPSMNQAFSGIKVLAVARVFAAPFAAYQMALQGADVITIESPGEGDSARRISDYGTPFRERNMSRFYLALNSNKRSMTLRLDTPQGQAVFRRLAADADVVIENLKTGSMARYGLGYEDLRKINPRIVFASVTGYGQTGPKRGDPGIDMAIQAASGMMSYTGTPASGPLRSGSQVVDYATGYAAALAIASALLQRTRTGVGQAVDVSMLETAMTLMAGHTVAALTGGGTPPLVGNASATGALSNTYPCKQGVLSIAAGTNLRRNRLWVTLGRPDLAQDARFSDAHFADHQAEAEAEVIQALAAKTAAEWEDLLNAAGVPAMRVVDLEEAVTAEQLRHREFFHHFDAAAQPGLPAFAVPTTSFKLSASPSRVTSPPPTLGQHTDEVLQQAGFTQDEIAQLHREGTV